MTETLTPLQQSLQNVGSEVTALKNNLALRYPATTPVTTTSTTSPIPPTATATAAETPLDKATREYYENLPRTVDEATIRENVRKSMQGQIDTTNALYDELAATDRTKADALNNRVRGINVNSGLGGSDFATANAVGQEEENAKVVESRNRERGAALATILGNIDSRANAEVKDKTAEADKNSQNYLTYLKGNQDKAHADLISAAGLGVSYDDFKTKEPARLTALLTQTGLNETQAKALFIANSPEGVYINKDKPEIVGGNAVFFKQTKDAATGKTTITSEAIPLPAGVDEKNVQVVARQDGIYIINKVPNKDGTYTTTKVGQPNAPKAPATAKITISEAKSSGLPLSVVGQTEEDIVNSLAEPKIPQWFVDKSKSEGISPTDQLWNDYRANVSANFGQGGA